MNSMLCRIKDPLLDQLPELFRLFSTESEVVIGAVVLTVIERVISDKICSIDKTFE